MDLILTWWSLVSQLEGGFNRKKTFYWAVMVIMGFSLRKDSLGGVSSFVRCLRLNPKQYPRMLHLFASSAVDLEKLTRLWVEAVLKCFAPFLLMVNGRPVVLIDGIVVGKEGRNMPGVQCIHQSSENNSKAQFVMGHYFQCLGILAMVPGLNTIFSVPLLGRIHLGTKTTNRDKRTLYDKAVEMLRAYFGSRKFYLVGDAYYAVGKMVRGVTDMGWDLIVRVRSNAVAYLPPLAEEMASRGRKKIYGAKVRLKDFFSELGKFSPMESPVYGEEGVEIMVSSIQLLSRRFGGKLLQFVFVIHPTRGKMILLSTDLFLEPREVIRLYSYRFKIEVAFRAAVHSFGIFLYRFWMRTMDKTKLKEKAKHLHKKSAEYRERYLEKQNAYHIFVQLGFIAQGVLAFLSMAKTKEVRDNFKICSWFRTLHPNSLPTELIAGIALKNCRGQFLAGSVFPSNLKKFIREKTVPIPEYEHPPPE